MEDKPVKWLIRHTQIKNFDPENCFPRSTDQPIFATHTSEKGKNLHKMEYQPVNLILRHTHIIKLRFKRLTLISLRLE